MCKTLPKNYIYPAIIEHCDGNCCLYFPDLPGCAASGDTVENTIEIGKKAAGEYLLELENNGSEIPAASPVATLKLNQGDTICMVDVNMLSIRTKMESISIFVSPLAKSFMEPLEDIGTLTNMNLNLEGRSTQ